MAAENGGFNEKAYIRQRFIEQTKDLPTVQRVKARLGFALQPVWDKIKDSKWFEKVSRPRDIVNPVSRADELESRKPGTRTGRR